MKFHQLIKYIFQSLDELERLVICNLLNHRILHTRNLVDFSQNDNRAVVLLLIEQLLLFYPGRTELQFQTF